MQLMSLYWQACRWSKERGTVARFYPVSWNARFPMRQQAAYGQQYFQDNYSVADIVLDRTEKPFTPKIPTGFILLGIEWWNGEPAALDKNYWYTPVWSHEFWFQYPSCHPIPLGGSDISWRRATPGQPWQCRFLRECHGETQNRQNMTGK